MSVGRCNLSITLAIVKVLPEPVTPSSVTSVTPSLRAEQSWSMASGWSPEGLKGDCILNFIRVFQKGRHKYTVFSSYWETL